MKSVDEVGEGRVEEELIVSDSRRHVLLLEDLIVVQPELEVGGAVPRTASYILLIMLTRRVFSRSIAWRSECPCRILTFIIK